MIKMILRNPTDNELSVQIRGKQYVLPARESVSLPEEDGRVWLRLHGFLVIENEEVKEVKEEPAEPVQAPTAAVVDTKSDSGTMTVEAPAVEAEVTVSSAPKKSTRTKKK